MKSKPEDWHKPRSHGTHFTEQEIIFIEHAYKHGRSAHSVAMELKCAARSVQARYASLAGRRDKVKETANPDARWIGPVEKRDVPPPNVTAGISMARLMGGK